MYVDSNFPPWTLLDYGPFPTGQLGHNMQPVTWAVNLVTQASLILAAACLLSDPHCTVCEVGEARGPEEAMVVAVEDERRYITGWRV